MIDDFQLVDMIQRWLIYVAVFMVAVIIAESIRKFRIRRPCWFYGHDRKYLQLYDTMYFPDGGRCNESDHELHAFFDWKLGKRRILKCYVAYWVCRKCPAMDSQCLGDRWSGAWKIEFERVVPDEKQWGVWGGKDDFAEGPK